MDGLIGIAGVVVVLWVMSGLIALIGRGGVSYCWLLAATAFVIVNDALLTNVYGLLPDLIGRDWNWQGKFLAAAATLAIAALPAMGWRASGLTLSQAKGSLVPACLVSLLYIGFFAALALAFPNDKPSAETLAFQMTMPGLEEEIFYRGALLLMLARAFTGRRRFLGVEWHWGGILSSVLFGLVHAFGFSDGTFSFDVLTMGLTSVPSLIGVWLVLRTRSVLFPVVLHNLGNTITSLV